MKRSLRRAAGGATASLSLALVLAGVNASPAAATASCYGASCNGLNPAKTTCANDARTVKKGPFIDMELRYSPSCRSAWARIGGHAPRGIKLTIRNTKGNVYSGNIAASGGGYFSVMVNDKDIKAWACGSWYANGSDQHECTDSY
ncbi:DUF2690 domain-containing protein [Streptomyces sp. BA2]|uniref:DUF2690 domain-containing protein n=1 Tax=Streptomyces sp. BA2 TaxID=436595 RepID=UPI0013269DA1|nr:DUF2690 domain-containing protein [Streptomyces sp. BA2]MWA15985.1 DUF2690 domain-containing protein [Streptomyces sp. BA2]